MAGKEGGGTTSTTGMKDKREMFLHNISSNMIDWWKCEQESVALMTATCESGPQAVLLRHVGSVLQEEGLGHRLAVHGDAAGDIQSLGIARYLV